MTPKVSSAISPPPQYALEQKLTPRLIGIGL
jgi:hypothetical protein